MGNQRRKVAKSGQWTIACSVFLHNVHAGRCCEVRLGVTRGSLLGHSSAIKNMMDPLISSAWVMELSVDSASISSSWERQTMVEQRLARACRKRRFLAHNGHVNCAACSPT